MFIVKEIHMKRWKATVCVTMQTHFNWDYLTIYAKNKREARTEVRRQLTSARARIAWEIKKIYI